MADVQILLRIKQARLAFARTLLPEGEAIAEMLEAGVSPQRVGNLYPEMLEGATPMRALPDLIDHFELPQVQELLEAHQGQIGNLWEDAIRAAHPNASAGQLRMRIMLREDWCERLLNSSEVMQAQVEVTQRWANAQALRFSQILHPGAKGQRSRHVRHLLVAVAYFWSLSEGALTAEEKYAEQILSLFEPLLEALADAKSQLHAAGGIG